MTLISENPVKILSVSSSRADAGILAPVWADLAGRSAVDLHILLTGMHMDATALPPEDIPDAAAVHKLGEDLGGGLPLDVAKAMGTNLAAAATIIEAVKPQTILLIGDRLDMITAAVASLPFNISLVHLHGGELTEGAIDDRIRHAISKLAHRHCVSSAGARARLIAMGVSEDKIEITGAPGLDTVLAAPKLSKPDFLQRVGLPPKSNFRLVTVHPETNSVDPLSTLHVVLDALSSRPAPTLFTAPNSDPGGYEAKTKIKAFAAQHNWAVYVDTLGSKLFANALRYSDLMLGNSSSGLIEAGIYGLPVINVGDRQKGRERGENVTDVANTIAGVISALDQLGSPPQRSAVGTPYGTGNSGPKIAAAVLEICKSGQFRSSNTAP